MPDPGFDLLCFDDLDENGAEVTGTDLLRQEVYHILTQTRGSNPDAPDVGEGVEDLLKRKMLPGEIATLPAKLSAAIMADERFAYVTGTSDTTGAVPQIRLFVTPADGSEPFPFVFNLGPDTLTLVEP